MKYLFAVIFAALAVASAGTYVALPDTQVGVPVITWVTDVNPARDEQVDLFHRWCVDQGYVVRRGEPGYDPAMDFRGDGTSPAVRLRLDFANANPTKQIMQGVSGVGADVIDLWGHWGTYFNEIGLLRDMTADAERLGYDTSTTWQAVVPDLTRDGRQYLFPCNVGGALYWVNRGTFERLGLESPPRSWTVETFEAYGRRFVEAANRPDASGRPRRERAFFASAVPPVPIYRSFGASRFNETLTRCTLDHPGYARTLALLRKWTYDDRLLPSAADMASFDTQQGYGGPVLQLFNRGNIAMFPMGTWALIQLRQFGSLNLDVVGMPYASGGLENSQVGTRAAGVYVGTGHAQWAARFQQFLASEPYNLQIVRSADGLPPVPAYAQSREFTHPPDYPNEWGLTGVFADWTATKAIVEDRSPFALDSVVNRVTTQFHEQMMNGMVTPGQAASRTAETINAEIERTLREKPNLRPSYDAAMSRQAEIDRLKAAGRKVPASLIANPFHLAYYRHLGILVEEGTPQ